MTSLAGIAITLFMVFGGYVIAGGKLEIILHSLPYELMIIGGAAVGSFLVGNDLPTVKSTLSDIGKAIRGPKWKREDYQGALCLMYELLKLARESALKVESHIENPAGSAIFQKYPKIAADHEALEIICDTIRSILIRLRICWKSSLKQSLMSAGPAPTRFKRWPTDCRRSALSPQCSG
jgi:chemotaxis protein MotA